MERNIMAQIFGDKMKPYKGIKKRLYKKIIKGGGRRFFGREEILGVKEGDLLHDCDAFNHRAKSIEFFKTHTRRGWFICDYFAIKDDGNSFCGCNSFPEKPHSREEIEAYVLRWNDEKGEYSDSVEEQIQQVSQMEGWEKFKKWVEVLKSGGHICDEDGILLEEFRSKHD
jgi:hypothetical protein